jgi:O-succinylbenzoic acid--CoA ligase
MSDPPAHYGAETYESINFAVGRTTARLRVLGVRRGDVVGTLMHSYLPHVWMIHALARLGAVLLPLNTRLTVDELRYQVDAADCKLLVCEWNYERQAGALQTPERRAYCIFRPVFRAGVGEIPDVTRDQFILDGELDLDAVQSIVFTSGTSGKPKGVQITFGNLYHGALASVERLGAQQGDRWLLKLPLYHIGGLSIVFRSCLYRTAFILPEYNFEEDLGWLLGRTQSTIVSLVPTQLYRLLEAGFEPPHSLRLILLGGAAATPELVQRCIERKLPVALTYGLTEAASQVATATPEQVRAKPGSVGKPLAGMTVRVVDDKGFDQPPGIPGEIVVSGATVMRGYLGQPAANGTLHTGDIGYLDADGDLWLVQRRSDLIVSGGENVYPSEVEAVLRQHPAVADACVVGVPDAEWGQRVAAMVALRPGSPLTKAALIAFSRERLAGYKQPRRVVFVDELPQTASGKVQRSKVLEKLLAVSD